MSLYKAQPNIRQLMLMPAAILLVSCFLTACTTTKNSETLQTVMMTPTATHMSGPRPDPKGALATTETSRNSQYATSVALTPPITKGLARWGTPGPTATLELGMLSGCGARANSRAPWTISCWRGIVNGNIIDLEAGRYGSDSDGSHGILIVEMWADVPYSIISRDIYETPQHLGSVRIASVNDMHVTLVPHNPWATQTPQTSPTPGVNFTFDLSTRQWVSPPPLSTPSYETNVGESHRREQAHEATRVAILTNVPQETMGPGWYPAPIVWSTPFPIPTNILYPAGAGMILEDGQAAGLTSAIGSFKNQWHREVDGIYTTVYAGSDKFQRSEGLVIVEVVGMNTHPTIQLYLTPLQLGPVRVTAATGELLTLRAENGTLFYFDVPTRQWISPPPLP